MLMSPNIEIVEYCQEQFGFKLTSKLISNPTKKFHSNMVGFNYRPI